MDGWMSMDVNGWMKMDGWMKMYDNGSIDGWL
jgi:hypothetical protein